MARSGKEAGDKEKEGWVKWDAVAEVPGDFGGRVHREPLTTVIRVIAEIILSFGKTRKFGALCHDKKSSLILHGVRQTRIDRSGASYEASRAAVSARCRRK